MAISIVVPEIAWRQNRCDNDDDGGGGGLLALQQLFTTTHDMTNCDFLCLRVHSAKNSTLILIFYPSCFSLIVTRSPEFSPPLIAIVKTIAGSVSCNSWLR